MRRERVEERAPVVEEDVDPDRRVGAGDACHVAQRPTRGRKRIVSVDPLLACLVRDEVGERVRQMARQRDEPVVRARARSRPASRRAPRRGHGRAGSWPDPCLPAASGTTSRRRTGRRSRARGRSPRTRRRDGRRRSAATPPAAAQTDRFVEPTSVTVLCGRASATTAATTSASTATGTATTTRSAPATASATDAHAHVDRPALDRARQSSLVGVEAGHGHRAGPLGGERDRRAHQPRADDREPQLARSPSSTAPPHASSGRGSRRTARRGPSADSGPRFARWRYVSIHCSRSGSTKPIPCSPCSSLIVATSFSRWLTRSTIARSVSEICSRKSVMRGSAAARCRRSCRSPSWTTWIGSSASAPSRPRRSGMAG